MNPIRNSAKAIIIKDNKILLTKNKNTFGEFYLLPGGGQNAGETISDALIRECIEEISTEVKIKELKFVRDYIGKNHQFSDFDKDIHQIEYMFLCEIDKEYIINNGNYPDVYQIGVEWVDLSELKNILIYPQILSDLILPGEILDNKIYLGDVN